MPTGESCSFCRKPLNETGPIVEGAGTGTGRCSLRVLCRVGDRDPRPGIETAGWEARRDVSPGTSSTSAQSARHFEAYPSSENSPRSSSSVSEKSSLTLKDESEDP